MSNKVVWMIAVAALASPFAFAQDKKAPSVGEEEKISQPADTSTKGKPKAKPTKLTPEQEKKLQMTGSENRSIPAPPKMTPEQKQADIKAKRKGVTPEEEQKQQKASPGG
jgi:hypothetical protein